MLYFDPRLSASPRSAAVPATTSGCRGVDARRHRSDIAGGAAVSECTDGLQCGIQHGAVLGRPGQRSGAAGRWSPGEPGRDGVTAGARHRATRGHPRIRADVRDPLPGGSRPLSLANAREGDCRVRGNPHHAQRAVRQVYGECVSADGDREAGLRLFLEKGCAACHYGIDVGGTRVPRPSASQNPGAAFLPPGDKGRFTVAERERPSTCSRCRPCQEHRAHRAVFRAGRRGIFARRPR